MTDRPYITCRQLIDFIVDYVDSTLEPEARLDFERHLARCASCRDYLRSYRTTLALEGLFVIGSDEPVEDAPEELVASILKRAR
jgi:anti-sigma factor RsiW